MSDSNARSTGSYEKRGYLTEGYDRKGGINPATSRVVTRPPAPAPMHPRKDPAPSKTPPKR